jgi:hypothetical protein
MPWTDCKLKLAITNEDGMNKLRFFQPPFGGELAIVRLPRSGAILSSEFGGNPPLFARIVLWIVCGARDYVPLVAVESPSKPYTFARFYRCIDRKNRERTFAAVGEVKSDSGATFLVKSEDFEIINQQLLQLKQEAQQVGPSNGG